MRVFHYQIVGDEYSLRDPATGLVLESLEQDEWFEDNRDWLERQLMLERQSRLMKFWHRRRRNLAKAEERLDNLSVFDPLLHEPGVMEETQKEFDLSKQPLLKAVYEQRKKLQEFERTMPPGMAEFLEDQRDEWLNAKWIKETEKLLEQGLAVYVGNSLKIWCSLERRREWETENPEKVAEMRFE